MPNNMSPFNGSFYGSDGSIHNLDELLIGGKDGFSPEITVKENTATTYILHIKTATYEFDTPNLRGGSGQTEQVINLSGIYVGDSPPDDKSVIWAMPVTDIS